MQGGGVESAVMQAVQLSIANGVYAATVREALSRSCAWHVEAVDRPDPSQKCVLVLDELAFARLPLPLSNPERVVLITGWNIPRRRFHLCANIPTTPDFRIKTL